MRKTYRYGSAWLVLALCIGCSTLPSDEFLGAPITDVINELGEPLEQYNTDEGHRVYEFRFGVGTLTRPRTTMVRSTSTAQGDNVVYSEAVINAQGASQTKLGCRFKYIAEWQEERQAWIVIDYQIPNQTQC